MRNRARYSVLIFISWIFCFLSRVKGGLGDQCGEKDQYFDVPTLSCQSCAALYGTQLASSGLVPDPEHSRIVQDSASDCTCRPGAIKVSLNKEDHCFSQWPRVCQLDDCEDCPANTAPTQDLATCISCGALGVNTTSMDCQCPQNYYLAERDNQGSLLATKECLACPNNTFSDAGAYGCKSCPDPLMKYTESTGCQCDVEQKLEAVGLQALGSIRCLPKRQIEAVNIKFPAVEATKLQYPEFGITLNSAIFRHYYIESAVRCYFYSKPSDGVACAALANLCVLQHFYSKSIACSVLEFIHVNGRTMASPAQIDGWVQTLPFLKYKAPARSVLTSQEIYQIMSFPHEYGDDSASLPKQLHYELAVYDLNGTLLHFEPLSRQLVYCNTESSSTTAGSVTWLNFGFGYAETFQCNLNTLVDQLPKFYELYFIDEHPDTKAKRRIPVPVRVLNYKAQGDVFVNKNLNDADIDNDQLTHRFFLFDTFSAREEPSATAQVIRYLSSISLEIQAQTPDTSKIYPPVLTLEYTDVSSPKVVSGRFIVEYTSSSKGFWKTATGFFITLCVVNVFGVVFRFVNWHRRNSQTLNDSIASCGALLEFVSLLVSTFARGFFWLSFSLSCYYLIAFKCKSHVAVLLPPSALPTSSIASDYYVFHVLLILAFTFQLFFVLHIIARQVQVDLFFIDWEKPRAKLIDSDSIQTADAPVSVWRTILVVNEWNEMQTIRRINSELAYMLLAFLLVGIDLQYVATPQPTLIDISPGPLNVYLRFANTSFWWLGLCYGQLVFNWLIYERCFSESKAQQFIDLCTMAKVSCFLLDERYHGFYLHCRSPYPFADGSMIEIADQLKQEEAGLMSGRGLQGGPDDCQSFELFITATWRKHYDQIYSNLYKSKTNSKQALALGRLGGLHNDKGKKKSGDSLPPSKLDKATRKLSLFLKGFIENHQPDYRWKILPTEGENFVTQWLHSIFRMAPTIQSKRTSLFRPDENLAFSSVVFLGIEHDLILLNVLSIGLFEYCLENTIAAIGVAYLIEKVLCYLRESWGNQNVAQKTLVDERFLI